VRGHGGNLGRLAAAVGCPEVAIRDFSANINPLGPPEYLWHIMARHLPDIVNYPEPDAAALTRKIAESLQLLPEQIVSGNGTSELLFTALRCVDCVRAVLPVPAYIDYARACAQAGVPVHPFALASDADFQPDVQQLSQDIRPGDLVILGQPNNPTGRLIPRQDLLALADEHPDVVFLVDEAFAGFVEDYTTVACARENIIVLCSLTKLFAVPGLRLGFLAASADFCTTLRGQLPPWAVNSLAQAAGQAVVSDVAFIEKSCQRVAANRQWLTNELARFSMLKPVASTANFLLIELLDSSSASQLAEHLLRRFHMAIRVCDNYQGLNDHFFRIAVRTQEENEQLIEALEEVLLPGKTSRKKMTGKKAPALMFLGTGSDVGKSVLVAGLCRVLLQDGIRVAPFKAQNMSLNSYVTRDGGEMGRAQVVQAQACRLDPDVRMNPILLKPNSDVGSQVIVHGRPVGNMRVKEYVRYKEQAWQEVCSAYNELATEFDCILLEGAGSPGEVNLKAHDIVNMRMAAFAKAPALLVGDIDRGGVYASFVGHVEVMAPWERDLLAGFVVNRFRGDASLLGDAHDFLQKRTGKQVLGVVPFIHDLDLPQEDSVSFKSGIYDSARPSGEYVEIALIDLPHISNFTDFDALLAEPDVHLRIVRKVSELGSPDCVLLPGSKNVVADLAYLVDTGLDRQINRLAEKHCEIVGICGGFQLLGRSIADPHGLEGEAGSSMSGLGLLETDTVLAAEKTLSRKEGIHCPSGEKVYGYEIHHGVSKGGGTHLLSFTDGTGCGMMDRSGRVWGCYLHGIFDSDGFRRSFINSLRKNKGLQEFTGRGASYDLEPALDRLADVIRQSLDMDEVYALLGL